MRAPEALLVTPVDPPGIPAQMETPGQLAQLQQDFRKHYPAVRVVTAARLVTVGQEVLAVLQVTVAVAVTVVVVVGLPKDPCSMVLVAAAGQGVQVVAVAEQPRELLEAGAEEVELIPELPVIPPVQPVPRAGALVVLTVAVFHLECPVVADLDGVAVAVAVVVLLTTPLREVAVAVVVAEVAVLEMLQTPVTPAIVVMQVPQQIQLL